MRRLLLLMVWLCLPMYAWGQTLNLTQIKHNTRSRTVNIYFSAEKPVKFRSYTLQNPSRLVIDIKGVSSFSHQVSAANLVDMPIKKIRSAALNAQSIRVVLDLKSAKNYHWNIVCNTPVFSKPIPLPSLKRSKEIIVVIDPGHGGKDPGAIGANNYKEKDVVLAIAKKLQNMVNKQPGFKAILTRNADNYLTLRERLNIARQNKADMFIAIHADAYADPFAQGVSVFALSLRGATSEAARWIATRENQSELMGGVELADKNDVLRSVLINLSQTATIQASLAIGQNLLNNIKPFANLHHQHMEQAAFVVLKSPDIPSLLVETGFLSNSIEEKKLNLPHYQYNLAQAIMLGIKQYFIARPPRGTWLASQGNYGVKT